ncbi:hypothetical protein [Halomicronema sp. CCY15110]|uniref:hypothetical protein n=1 Tax=Halomicronema sp. CCY15110 TaxID=2767773 RepID=UPI001951AF40|nr:hypothetical protein [Halomicronema sp. CCY15110]
MTKKLPQSFSLDEDTAMGLQEFTVTVKLMKEHSRDLYASISLTNVWVHHLLARRMDFFKNIYTSRDI